MASNKLIKSLNYVILALLFSPFLQSKSGLFAEKELGGVYEPIWNPKISIKSWWKGDFQNSKEAYLQHNFGFRKPLLRFRYQWMYSFYSMPRTTDFVVGKEGYIFENSYVDEYRGGKFIGEEIIDSIMLKADAVQQKLKEIGIPFLVVIAPSKAHYYNEYLPDYCVNELNNKTNYKEYLKRLNSKNIPIIDANAWFLSIKDTTSFPLFPKTGTHFSTYGAAVVIDSMLRYWEQQLDQDIPDFYWTDVEWTDTLRDEDTDLEWAMNLMYPIPNHKMPYPIIQINRRGKYKPNILTIGDSFFWRFYRWNGISKIYNDSKFLYYNKEIYPGQYKRETYNLEYELGNLDAICIFINPTQFKHFSWGIINDLYEVLHDTTIAKEDILKMMKQIKNTPAWLAQIEKKAVANNMQLESMLHLDAKYILKEQIKKSEETMGANSKELKKEH